MSTVLFESHSFHIPPWVVDLKSFRRWFQSDDFPETGRICFLSGEVWVDMSKEQIFTHNQVKGEFSYVLKGLAKIERSGRFFGDGVHLTNEVGDLSVQPDGTYISAERLATKKVQLVEGRVEGYVELLGSPDMTLEVVSISSVHKDTVVLMEAYWQAGIREYWLVDARRPPLQFDIFRHTSKGYVANRKQAGWVKSAVFGKSFRLTQQNGADGYPEYALAVR